MLVKLLSQKGSAIRDAKVLMLGITFKENCPDIRNSRVIDIIRELQSFGTNVDVYDPLADAGEVLHEYGLSLTENLEDAYDGIVIAVGHDTFRKIDWSKYRESGTVIYDVKSFLEKGLVDNRL